MKTEKRKKKRYPESSQATHTNHYKVKIVMLFVFSLHIFCSVATIFRRKFRREYLNLCFDAVPCSLHFSVIQISLLFLFRFGKDTQFVDLTFWLGVCPISHSSFEQLFCWLLWISNFGLGLGLGLKYPFARICSTQSLGIWNRSK